MTVFVPEQFVHTEVLFYKGTRNQGLDKNQVSDKIIQDIHRLHTGFNTGSIQVSNTRKDNTYRFHCSFICPASSLQLYNVVHTQYN